MIVNINKTEGLTSFKAVAAVRSIYGEKKAGHCGTLDPCATGVLPVMLGNSVKASEYLTNHDKKYTAEIKFGIETDTGDIWGNVIKSHSGLLPGIDALSNALFLFTGSIMQTPPMYSALKVGGRKLCDIARKGGEVYREPRCISVYELSAYLREGALMLDITCSRGTYIRTLCTDIGSMLGCGAVMASLCRTSVGKYSNGTYKSMFDISNAVALDDLRKMDESARNGLLISPENIFDDLPKIVLPPFFERLFSNGAEIYTAKIGADFLPGTLLSVYGSNGFFALGEVLEFPDGLAIKPKKFFT